MHRRVSVKRDGHPGYRIHTVQTRQCHGFALGVGLDVIMLMAAAHATSKSRRQVDGQQQADGKKDGQQQASQLRLREHIHQVLSG